MTTYSLRLEGSCQEGHFTARETGLSTSNCPARVGTEEEGTICGSDASWTMSMSRGNATLTETDIFEMAAVGQIIMHITGLAAGASLNEIRDALELLHERARTATLLEGGACNRPHEENGVLVPGDPCGRCIQCALAGSYVQVPGR